MVIYDIQPHFLPWSGGTNLQYTSGSSYASQTWCTAATDTSWKMAHMPQPTLSMGPLLFLSLPYAIWIHQTDWPVGDRWEFNFTKIIQSGITSELWWSYSHYITLHYVVLESPSSSLLSQQFSCNALVLSCSKANFNFCFSPYVKSGTLEPCSKNWH